MKSDRAVNGKLSIRDAKFGKVCCNYAGEGGETCRFLAIRFSGSDAACRNPDASSPDASLALQTGWAMRSEECKNGFRKADEVK